MNSVTGESGPVSIDRPRPAISHEVPGRVERPGPVTPPVGLEGARAPCGSIKFSILLHPRYTLFVGQNTNVTRAEGAPTGFKLRPFQPSPSPAATDSNLWAGLYIQQA